MSPGLMSNGEEPLCAGWLEMKEGDAFLWEVKWVCLRSNYVEYSTMEHGKVEGSFTAAHIQEMPSHKNAFLVYNNSGGNYCFKVPTLPPPGTPLPPSPTHTWHCL